MLVDECKGSVLQKANSIYNCSVTDAGFHGADFSQGSGVLLAACKSLIRMYLQGLYLQICQMTLQAASRD